MTVSRDLVNHNKWPWYKVDSSNGKNVMKLVTLPILGPMAFRCAILERFESLKILRVFFYVCWMAKSTVFFIQTSLIFLTLKSPLNLSIKR